MKLVHGTSIQNAASAMEFGLKPRGRAPSRWDGCPSSPDAVYFTNAYGLFYAINAAETQDHSVCLIEVETEQIENLMVADEDALEQAWRFTRDNLLFPLDFDPKMDMVQRTQWFAKNLIIGKRLGFDHKWSLKKLGNCAHYGSVEAKHITKMVAIDNVHKMWWIQFFDPTITFANYLFLGEQYKISQLVLMDRVDEALDFAGDNNRDYVQWLEALVQPNRRVIFQA